MTVQAGDEAPRRGSAPGASDAVTFSFGDPAAGRYGVARVGLSEGPGRAGTVVASGLAMLFAGHEPVAVRAAGGLELDEASWEAIDAAGVRTETVEPLRAWRVSFVSEDGDAGFELDFAALSTPAELAADRPVAAVGGMEGYEQLCRVTGTVTVSGEPRPVVCLGQRGHSWGAPDWERIALARTVSAWLDEDLAVALTAVRPAGAGDHAEEAVDAFLVQRDPDGDEGSPVTAVAIAEPRISTTYDSDGRQRRAGLELYVEDEGHPLRLAGEVACGTSLDLGRLRLDAAFFTWRMGALSGVGRYDVLRRVDG